MLSKAPKIVIRKNLELLDNCLDKLKSKEGSIIAISGDEGYGKTHLINAFAERANENYPESKIIIEKNASPIGSFNIGNIQPLLPFTRIMEKILLGDTYDQSSAKTKFFKNAGLSLLASAPVIDTVFYAVKELGRDLRQYQKDKSSEKRTKRTSGTTKDYFDSFCSRASKKPLILIIDDFHWSDAQSVELVDIFAEDVVSIPIILIIAFRQSIVSSQASPLLSFIDNKIDKSRNIIGIKLQEFSKEEISSLSK